ncbi:uncharacterized protein LOC128963681 [Oppia nitens]|uniref:uncharacterized protein LOC128963681 n=1 Tax=Oppia nitens TaxID=1686743 RepID=UPI0023DA1D3E|nr:uncharacterized protein LOC128963681 [Oppia nitens]
MDGRVDLVFTSFMLHYCSRDKRQVMAIFRQLLKSDGLFYGNILINQDLNRKLLGKGKERDPNQQWYPSLDKQTEDWLKSLTDNGFMIEKSKLIELNVGMNRKQIIDFMPVVVDCYRCYFPDSQQFDAEVGDHLWDTVFDAFFSPPDAEPNPSAWTKFLADNTITELHYYFHCLRVIATKK